MIDFIMIIFAKYLFWLILLGAGYYFYLLDASARKQMVIFACIVLPLAFLLSRIVSNFYFSPRPFVVYHFTPLISHIPDNGFPSDHALLSFAVAALIFLFNKRVGVMLFLLGGVVGISRIYSGVHSFIDILGSFIIAAAVAYFVQLVYHSVRKPHYEK